MRIFYATDGSSPARHGEALIASLFDVDKAQVDVFTVQPEAVVDSVMADAGYEMARMDMPVISAEAVARESAERLADKGFTSSWSSAQGAPAHEIVARVTRDPYDLVVVGGSHTSWLGNALLGSVSMHVLHESPSSVLVAHTSQKSGGKVLIGVDGSNDAFEALRAVTHAFDTARCEIEVATVVAHPWVPSAVPQAGFYMGQLIDEERAGEERRLEQGHEIVERSVAYLRREGFRAEPVVLMGRPGPQLLKEADNIAADLVVVGCRGLGTMRRTLLGSVSDQVVRHAPAALVARHRPTTGS